MDSYQAYLTNQLNFVFGELNINIGDVFSGERWIRYDSNLDEGRYDTAVMPIYDVNGFIAGIQIAVSFKFLITK